MAVTDATARRRRVLDVQNICHGRYSLDTNGTDGTPHILDRILIPRLPEVICQTRVFARRSPHVASFCGEPDRLNFSGLSHQILGPASLEHARGQALTLRSATDASPCALASSATYSWSLEGLNTSRVEQSSLELPKGRDPRVLRLPPNSLGYAGSVYAFRLDVAVGNLINSAVVTGG